VLEFRAKHAGTPHATAATTLLGKLPSPLDRVAFDNKPFVRAAGLGPAVGSLAFGADDSRLVIARAGKAPEELALPDLTPTARFADAEVAGHAASLSPAGRTAAAADPAGRVVVWGPAGVRTLEIPGLAVRAVGLMPDGKGAVVVPSDPEAALARVDLVTGKVLGRLDVRAVGIRDVAVAADGSVSLLTADDGTARVTPLPAGSPVRTIEPFPDAPGPAVGAFAPDGGRLYLAGIEHSPGRYPPGADRSDLLYELPGARPNLWRFGPWRPRVSALAVSADETAVAVGTATGRVVVYAAGTGKPTADLTLPGGLKALAFSTHGRVLAAALDGGRVVLVPIPR
jgi:WD40 repeat protein